MGYREEVIGAARLILGDCREIMASMPDNSVDMIWTDPPYGHSNHDGDFNSRLNEHRGLTDAPIANDDPESMRAAVDGMLTEAARILRRDCCCCCCGGGPRPTFAWVASRMDAGGLQFFHSVIWDKVNPGLGWRYRRQHEMVMVAHRAGGRLLWADDGRAQPNIVKISPPRERVHPNEKPQELVAQFIGLHSSPGHSVLDPFMGSGTTGVVCVNLDRSFVGIELHEPYFDIACRRLERACRQPRLFDEPRARPVQASLAIDGPAALGVAG